MSKDHLEGLSKDARVCLFVLRTYVTPAMKDLPPHERLVVASKLMEPYCPHCGGPKFPNPKRKRICQCWNDE